MAAKKKPVPVTRSGMSAKAGFADAAEVGWKPSPKKKEAEAKKKQNQKKAASKKDSGLPWGAYDSLRIPSKKAGGQSMGAKKK